MTPHETLLDRYAELTIKSGLGLKPGQQVLLTAPLEAVDLVRRITFHAYKAGASLVTTLYNDEQTALMRYTAGHEASFDAAPAWLFNGMAEAFRDGNCARLAIIGEDPALLAGQDPEKLSRANRARSKAYKPVIELITQFAPPTGASSPPQRRPMPAICSRIYPKNKRCKNSGTQFSNARERIYPTPLPRGTRITKHCMPASNF
jgi:Thermophilic metalloprotease (M29)